MGDLLILTKVYLKMSVLYLPKKKKKRKKEKKRKVSVLCKSELILTKAYLKLLFCVSELVKVKKY